MADRMLFVGWGEPVRGREERALEVFNDAMGILGRMEQEGRIERFDVVLLQPNGELGGYIELLGSMEQLAALQEDDEFRRLIVDGQLVVDADVVLGQVLEVVLVDVLGLVHLVEDVVVELVGHGASLPGGRCGSAS